MGLIGCPETSATTSVCCVDSQKNADLIYTVAEAQNHKMSEFILPPPPP